MYLAGVGRWWRRWRRSARVRRRVCQRVMNMRERGQNSHPWGQCGTAYTRITDLPDKQGVLNQMAELGQSTLGPCNIVRKAREGDHKPSSRWPREDPAQPLSLDRLLILLHLIRPS